jgi:uncharacterized protein YeaO (DUF488 family)
MKIATKRVYEPPSREDGARFLVERLWPRGIKKVDLPMRAWCRDVAPSTELRRWFHHEPEKWPEFERRYHAELERNREAWEPLLQAAKEGPVTLIYSAHDEERNSAVVLKAFLESKGAKGS